QGQVQLLFGIQSPKDPAGTAVARLKRRFPDHDIELLADGREHGQNPKISSLLNMLPGARCRLIVMADSDIRVGPDYLNQVVSSLSAPNVGLVTALYRGLPDAGIWARLSAAGNLVAASRSLNQRALPAERSGRPRVGSGEALLRCDHCAQH